jgi:hypothetical protein
MAASKRRDNSKEVKIQPVPEVRVYKIDDDNATPDKAKPRLTNRGLEENISNSNKSFRIFFANITSFSRQAQDYLFTLPRDVQVVMLAEVHKEEQSVISRFRKNKFLPCYNPPTNKNQGTHGGEIVATRAHLQAKPIPKEVIGYLISQFGPLHFAAKIVILTKVQVLFVSVYLWDSEGLSERNNTILQTIGLMSRYLKLPMIGFGDFNVAFDDFAKSGWCERLQVSLIHPRVPTTLSTTSNRVIDFGFISTDIQMMWQDVQPDLMVPWGPHIGMYATFNMKPKSISQYVQCIPKALPLDSFIANWNVLDSNQQNLAWAKAQLKSKRILFKHKIKTGVAILGQPNEILLNDGKFQGALQRAQIKEGERLAASALASELLVVEVANIPRDKHKLYTGRSQYPKFDKKPIIKSNKYEEFCPHLNYWCTVKQLTLHVRNEYQGADSTVKDKLIKALSGALEFASSHSLQLNDKWRDEAAILHRLVLSHNEFTLTQILNSVDSIHKFIVNKSLNELNIKWNKYVREQLSLGGGICSSLFRK